MNWITANESAEISLSCQVSEKIDVKYATIDDFGYIY